MAQDNRSNTMARQAAETLSLRALAWAASDEAEEASVFDGFIAQSGLSRDELATRAGEPEFLAAFLDYLLTEEAWVIACAAAIAVPPQNLLAARAALPGGDVVHWT